MVMSNVAGDLAECNESSKMGMTVGVMRWGILKETQHKRVIFIVTIIVCTTISKSTGYAVL